MSVSVTEKVVLEPFKLAFPDPNLPAGRWRGAAFLTGDGTGGVGLLSIGPDDFRAVRNTWFNVEWFSPRGGPLWRIYNLVVNTGERTMAGELARFIRLFQLPLPIAPGVDAAVDNISRMIPRELIWKPTANSWSIGATGINPSAGNYLAVYVLGLYWLERPGFSYPLLP